MRTDRRNHFHWARIGMILGVCLWATSGCRNDPSPPVPPGEARWDQGETRQSERREEQTADRKQGEESWNVLSLSLEEIAQGTCEHDLPTYACDECRYETGVVRVPDSLRKRSAENEPGLIRTLTVGKHPVALALKVTGEVQRNENATVHVGPRIPGIIESVPVDIGSRVSKGDLLFTVDSVELGRLLSKYEQSRTLTALSRKNLDRETSLFQRRISSEQDMIDATMVYEQHNTERKAAEQALQVLGLTEEDLTSPRGTAHRSGAVILPVRAPLESTIIEKHAVAGERVETGSDMMLLSDLKTLWVWADIYEQDLPLLIEAGKQGPTPAEVFVRAFPDRVFQASIDYIGATMDEGTRTVKVRATVENPDRLLRPGMFCEIHMEVSGTEEVPAIPRAALLSNEGQDFVFKHWKEDYFVARPVKKGREFSGGVEILEGLSPGDTIVSDGAFLLKSDILRSKLGAGCAD
jgi:membrane fusion protein, heavy metal efflux system